MSLFVLTATLLLLLGGLGVLFARDLVRAVLGFVVALLGLAGLFFGLDAPFLALAQILIYVGAVAVLMVFVILLSPAGARVTRGEDRETLIGLGLALVVAAGLAGAILTQPLAAGSREGVPEGSEALRAVGLRLLTEHLPTLQLVGLLLTVALLGAVWLAMPGGRTDGEEEG